MHAFFEKLRRENEDFLVELEFGAELLLCREQRVVDQALAAVPGRMIQDTSVRAVVDAIRDGDRDPVGLYKRLEGRPPFRARQARVGDNSTIPTINMFLGEMMEIGLGASFVMQRARQVIDQYRARSAKQIGAKLIASESKDAEIGSLLRECEASLTKLRSETYSETTAMPDLVAAVLAGFSETGTEYPEFGIPRLDNMLGGLEPGSNTLVGALTSVGKSAFVQQAALQMAKQGWRVLLFTGEMTQERVAERFIIMESGLSRSQCREPNLLTEDSRAELMRAANVVGGTSCEIVYCPGWTVEKLVDHCLERHAEDQVDVVIVDYLQLLSSERRMDSSEKEIDFVSRTICDMGGKMMAATLVCAQLNDEAEKVQPRLRHIRGSKAPVQHADNVVMLSRAKVGVNSDKMEIFVRKNRDGPLGEFEVGYVKHCYQFVPEEAF